jgi:hypothetical protein
MFFHHTSDFPTINTLMHVYEDMNQILDRLYLGNCWAAEKKEQLKAVGITHIVVVGIGLEVLYSLVCTPFL